MTPAEVLAALTPEQRHGLAFWTSIIDAMIPPHPPEDENRSADVAPGGKG